MLTLTLVGTAEDASHAASLAYNMGVTVKVVDTMGATVVMAEPKIEVFEPEPAPVDEPYPVLEREITESTPETNEPVESTPVES